MELTWAGYRINVRVKRRRTGRRIGLAGSRKHGSQLAPQRREVEKKYLLASGCRYVAPSR
jgi:hypothetical protein